MNFLSAKTLTVLAVTVPLFFATTILFKNSKISSLKQQLESTKKTLQVKVTENTLCNFSLNRQNKAINKLRIKSKVTPVAEEKIKKIFIKDKTCEAELKAYKELFYATN